MNKIVDFKKTTESSSIATNNCINYMTLEEIVQQYKQLLEKQQEIIKELSSKDSKTTAVLNGNCNGNTNSIQNSIVLQISGASEDMAEQIIKKIKDLSGESIEKVIMAVGKKIDPSSNTETKKEHEEKNQ